jgi:hypothetical protein
MADEFAGSSDVAADVATYAAEAARDVRFVVVSLGVMA